MKLLNGALEINWYGFLKRQVRDMVLRGEVIGAIKHVRDKRKGMNLSAAKEYVDRVRDELGVRRP